MSPARNAGTSARRFFFSTRSRIVLRMALSFFVAELSQGAANHRRTTSVLQTSPAAGPASSSATSPGAIARPSRGRPTAAPRGPSAPRNSGGRVYCGCSSRPSSKLSSPADASFPSTPGSSRATASTTAQRRELAAGEDEVAQRQLLVDEAPAPARRRPRTARRPAPARCAAYSSRATSWSKTRPARAHEDHPRARPPRLRRLDRRRPAARPSSPSRRRRRRARRRRRGASRRRSRGCRSPRPRSARALRALPRMLSPSGPSTMRGKSVRISNESIALPSSLAPPLAAALSR